MKRQIESPIAVADRELGHLIIDTTAAIQTFARNTYDEIWKRHWRGDPAVSIHYTYGQDDAQTSKGKTYALGHAMTGGKISMPGRHGLEVFSEGVINILAAKRGPRERGRIILDPLFPGDKTGVFVNYASGEDNAVTSLLVTSGGRVMSRTENTLPIFPPDDDLGNLPPQDRTPEAALEAIEGIEVVTFVAAAINRGLGIPQSLTGMHILYRKLNGYLKQEPEQPQIDPGIAFLRRNQ